MSYGILFNFNVKNSKWVWSGNTTITNRRQPRGTTRKSRSTIMRQQTPGRQIKLSNQKQTCFESTYNKKAVCSKIFISFYLVTIYININFCNQKIFFMFIISTKYHFDLSKVKDIKTHKQRNRQLFSSSRIHSISVKLIKVTYITILNIIRSYVCPKCYQRQNTIGHWKAKILRM